jgi:hypothetical protein
MRFSGAGSVIVLAVFGQDVIQVAHIEDEQVIQTLLTHAAYPSLSMRIGVRGMVWCGVRMTFIPSSLKHRIKYGEQLHITVMQYKAYPSPLFLQPPHQLSYLLRYPVSCWSRGAASWYSCPQSVK